MRLVELTADLSGVKPGGVHQLTIPNASLVAGGRVGLPAEGSQMVKVRGRYYLFNITWPRSDMRTQIVHRAERIDGPYERRVVLRDKGVAQGSVIDTPDGEWYAYLFQEHGAVGRVPFLVPMRGEDGWPVLGVDGKVPMTLDKVHHLWPRYKWGWDHAMVAMCAARLRKRETAVDVLLHPDFHFSISGTGYFPGRGGLLYAVAMMAAGWDGCPEGNAPGFPDDGSWNVQWEGLKPALGLEDSF